MPFTFARAVELPAGKVLQEHWVYDSSNFPVRPSRCRSVLCVPGGAERDGEGREGAAGVPHPLAGGGQGAEPVPPGVRRCARPPDRHLRGERQARVTVREQQCQSLSCVPSSSTRRNAHWHLMRNPTFQRQKSGCLSRDTAKLAPTYNATSSFLAETLRKKCAQYIDG